MQRRQLFRLLGSLSIAFAIGTVGSLGTMAAHAADKPLKVGVRGGVDEEIWEVVTKVAKSRGLNVEPIVVSGTASPNEALNNGDLDASAIVNSFAYQAGLIATRDGIAVEKRENNPYVNIIAVREKDKNAPWVAPLVKAYQSEEVRKFIETKYQGSVVPAF
ncbi:metal ABC transporter substrate-binding protein [Pandoraea capi]|uniref:Metal ABC transporter substrate-binding protein n=1 Tax=Pandoraea capi TaxID=2508286 RepID=A0ABY6W896_9BURK|nr:MetQ/NlpA family ABC transporter substrate-binding protein [Pandoraea capi]VVE38370.1 metal ABC transporter substrate-binding protein [Pandoraea capi]